MKKTIMRNLCIKYPNMPKLFRVIQIIELSFDIHFSIISCVQQGFQRCRQNFQNIMYFYIIILRFATLQPILLVPLQIVKRELSIRTLLYRENYVIGKLYFAE